MNRWAGLVLVLGTMAGCSLFVHRSSRPDADESTLTMLPPRSSSPASDHIPVSPYDRLARNAHARELAEVGTGANLPQATPAAQKLLADGGWPPDVPPPQPDHDSRFIASKPVEPSAKVQPMPHSALPEIDNPAVPACFLPSAQPAGGDERPTVGPKAGPSRGLPPVSPDASIAEKSLGASPVVPASTSQALATSASPDGAVLSRSVPDLVRSPAPLQGATGSYMAKQAAMPARENVPVVIPGPVVALPSKARANTLASPGLPLSAPASANNSIQRAGLDPSLLQPMSVCHRESVSDPSPVPGLRQVKQKRFSLDYEIHNVGLSGVAGVELWYTQDGRTWRQHAFYSQQQSLVIEVPDEGLYGFTLLARSGAGLSKQPPQPGDSPQVWVEVDATAPVVRLLDAEPGTGSNACNLTILWTATDNNLDAEPISIFYAEHAAGPWQPVARRIQNTGRYVWPMPSGMPPRFFVRVEATDRAGNVGVAQTPNPVLGDVSVPTVLIRDVGPARQR